MAGGAGEEFVLLAHGEAHLGIPQLCSQRRGPGQIPGVLLGALVDVSGADAPPGIDDEREDDKGADEPENPRQEGQDQKHNGQNPDEFRQVVKAVAPLHKVVQKSPYHNKPSFNGAAVGR